MRVETRTFRPLILVLHLAALALAFAPPVFFGAVVAPSVFHVLPTKDLAAALVSPILSRLCVLAEACFGVLFATGWLLTGRGAPRMLRALATRLPVLGFFAAIVIQQLLIPPMDRIRAEAPGLIDNLPAADPSRVLLDRYHRLSTGFFTLEIASALALLVVTARLLSPPADAAPAATGTPGPKPVPKILDLG
ncbi:MAG TPA: hypothetical protein VGH97_08290 [Thermoanaerobaculia bacterium]